MDWHEVALSEPAEVKHTLLRFSCLAIDLETWSATRIASTELRVANSLFRDPWDRMPFGCDRALFRGSNLDRIRRLWHGWNLLLLCSVWYCKPMAAARPVCPGKLFKMNWILSTELNMFSINYSIQQCTPVSRLLFWSYACYELTLSLQDILFAALEWKCIVQIWDWMVLKSPELVASFPKNAYIYIMMFASWHMLL